jgi:hypothetical protein
MDKRRLIAALGAGGLLAVGTVGASVVSGAAQDGPAVPAGGEEQAIEIALAEYPGTEVLATESEEEGGLLIWEVELSNGVEVEVDAATGEIVETEQDTPGEADDNDAGESGGITDLFDT